MPIDMAMHDPRPCVVGPESNGHIVARTSSAHNIALDGVRIVVNRAPGAAHNAERMSVQMDRVREASRSTGHRDLNHLILGKDVDTSSGKEGLRSTCTAQDLEENRNRRLVEGRTINLEFEDREVELDVEVDLDVGITEARYARGCGVGEGVEVRLEQRRAVGRLGRNRVGVGGSDVAQDGGVDATRKAGGTDVGVGANPVVGGRPVGIQNKRVPLPGKDLNAVDVDWTDIDTINFDDSQNVSIDGENVVGVARDRDKAKAVSTVANNRDDSKGGSGTSSIAALTVDECSIGSGDDTSRRRWNVIPIGQGDDGRFIVDVVPGPVGVQRVIDNHRTSEAVAILRDMMGVVPESSSLVGNCELIQERMARSNRTLRNARRSICPGTAGLEESMPMDTGGPKHGSVRQQVDDIQRECVSLVSYDEGTWELQGARGRTSQHGGSSKAIGRDVLVGDMKDS